LIVSARHDTPLVSVIVPTRNSGRTLEACLTSIGNQSYASVETIVVDNGSTDRTVDIAARLAQIVERYGPERSAQRNRGAFLAHGIFLLFIDSDMELGPDVVADCIEKIEASQSAGVIVPEITSGQGFWARCRQLERSCYPGDDLVEAARFFRRETFLSASGFDETLTGPEDWDLSRRLAPTGGLPRSSAYITHLEGTVRLSEILAKRRYYGPGYWKYWRKHGSAALRQGNVLGRPAFFRNWRRLASHPLTTAGLLSLKFMEVSAVGLGVAGSWIRAGHSTNSHLPKSA
jgi:glycosyltransferase involved in cell wall biosynthesis